MLVSKATALSTVPQLLPQKQLSSLQHFKRCQKVARAVFTKKIFCFSKVAQYLGYFCNNFFTNTFQNQPKSGHAVMEALTDFNQKNCCTNPLDQIFFVEGLFSVAAPLISSLLRPTLGKHNPNTIRIQRQFKSQKYTAMIQV